MFGNSKPVASLSSGLLARKGQARPAMRPQGYISLSPATSGDDLGWNDMGDTPAVEAAAPVGAPAPVPPVLRERAALEAEIAASEPDRVEAAPPPRAAVPVAQAARIGREARARNGKAAFTLRLDAERHLRLRLASAVCGRSAQALMTQALDAFLETLPEVEELARQLPAGTKD